MIAPEAAILKKKKAGGLRVTLDDRARGAVIRAGARLFREGEGFYRALGLTGLQYNVLRVLDAAGEALSQQEIARRVFASRANVTSLIDQLEAKGLVARGACADRRVKMVALTEAARETMAATYPELAARSAALMARLTDAEKKELIRLLDRLEGV